MNWEIVIGLEIHVQLATQSKLFSGASAQFGAEANTQACGIDIGLPGVLPVLNQEAVHMAVKFGLATQAALAPRSVFARKNYFYPDLPKGYQISQYELPIVGQGSINIDLEDGSQKSIRITRAHLEEDAGKSLHEDFHGMTGIDLNRAGVPLLEIVSEPDMRSAKEAVAYARKIHALIRYLDISDGNMQEGSMRCDANVSLRLQGDETLGTRTELKNINSFRFLERAINYEVERQREILESGGSIIQETRLYDADKHETRSMRSKESANDYRYFPDPDLLSVELDAAFIDGVRAKMPELPEQKQQRFMRDFALNAEQTYKLTLDKNLANYFEETAGASNTPVLAANWITGELSAQLNAEERDISQTKISSAQLAQLLARISDNTISGKIAKDVFQAMWAGEGDADDIIKQRGLQQITDNSALEKIIADIIASNPEQVTQYRAGKEKVFGFFVGQVMKQSQGKANPAQVNELLKQMLQP